MSREEERKYRGDVFYEVWRGGGNPDRIDDDRVMDSYYAGYQADEAASREMNRMRPRPQREEQQECEQWPEEQWTEEDVSHE